MSPTEADALRVASRLCHHVTGYTLAQVLREFPKNEEAQAALAVLAPWLKNCDRTRN